MGRYRGGELGDLASLLASYLPAPVRGKKCFTRKNSARAHTRVTAILTLFFMPPPGGHTSPKHAKGNAPPRCREIHRGGEIRDKDRLAGDPAGIPDGWGRSGPIRASGSSPTIFSTVRALAARRRSKGPSP